MNKNEAITKIKRQETRENREEQKGALIYGDQDQYIYIYIYNGKDGRIRKEIP